MELSSNISPNSNCLSQDSNEPTLSSSSPSVFHPFPLLPTELRLKIWSFYHQSTPPKKLRFSYRNSDTRQPARVLEGCFSSHGHSSPRNDIPTILHICHESRNFGLDYYSVGFEVPQLPELAAKGVHKAFEECSYEDAVGREGRGVFWNKEKDVMCIDGYWLDDNLKAVFWAGKSDVKFPGVRWVVFDENTSVQYVQDKAIGWVGIEMVFLVRWDLGMGSRYGAWQPRLEWEKMFKEGSGKPELRVVRSWKDVLEFLHEKELW
ncbi:hypothetical protein L207DRAFT_513697 [Hyaloscypha variabilis F]|uniref:2EXR domain-containing protein n=1 Tax=Hyaloscypha variabilis (strain UAMH 11265 / GT02V1 / F) TaxID=1149755 RepID=A0A2J6RL12_HYAVF|nr:hypothetical protein L207DRAFT_513697 [Hyaloscypha variabilis F]